MDDALSAPRPRLSRIATRLAIAAVVAVVVGYIGVVGYIASQETNLVFVSAGERLRSSPVPRDDVGIPWDTVRVRSDDGAPVLLLESRADTAAIRPWVIYFHGNAGLLGSRGNVARYALLREAGFNVLAVEYRGYGASASAGKPTEAGVYADARAAWEHATRTLGVPPERLATYGWSLGSGPATYLGATKPAALVMVEGAFTTLPDVGATIYPWLPVRLIMRNRFPNIERADALGGRLLVLHGDVDRDVPISHGRALVATARGSRLVTLSAGHEDGVIGDRSRALEAIQAAAAALAR